MAWLAMSAVDKKGHDDCKSRLKSAASHAERLNGRQAFKDHMATLDAEQYDLAKRILEAERVEHSSLDRMGEPLVSP